MSTALRRLSDIRLQALPRMADFATWVAAASPAFGWTEDAFLIAYATNRCEAQSVALDACQTSQAVLALAATGPWEGTAAELLDKLRGPDSTRWPDWLPKSPRWLTSALKRSRPLLRARGVTVDLGRRAHGGRRLISIQQGGDFSVTSVTSVTRPSGAMTSEGDAMEARAR